LIIYYNIRNGAALLRKTEDPGGVEYDALNSTGRWTDGIDLAVSTVISCDNIDWEEITEPEAAKLAERLGGTYSRPLSRKWKACKHAKQRFQMN
jgi:hypothetical protein